MSEVHPLWKATAAAGVLLFVGVAGAMLVLGTTSPFVVVGGKSMEPTLHEGDLLLVRGVHSTSGIETGDIVVFEKDGRRIVHRVVDKGTSRGGTVLKTHGDSNPYSSIETVALENVRGKVVLRLPYLGRPFLLID